MRYGDVRKGLPVADGTVRGYYASHVLEHLSLADFRLAIANTYKMLAPGGIFRLIVPDLAERARRYVAQLNERSPDAATNFFRSAALGEERPLSIGRRARTIFSGSVHLWMWDEYSLSAELQPAGFVNVRKCKFGDAKDAKFSRVEDPGRFYDEASKIHECAIEAQKL